MHPGLLRCMDGREPICRTRKPPETGAFTGLPWKRQLCRPSCYSQLRQQENYQHSGSIPASGVCSASSADPLLSTMEGIGGPPISAVHAGPKLGCPGAISSLIHYQCGSLNCVSLWRPHPCPAKEQPALPILKRSATRKM